jgi:hypothetical protein
MVNDLSGVCAFPSGARYMSTACSQLIGNHMEKWIWSSYQEVPTVHQTYLVRRMGPILWSLPRYAVMTKSWGHRPTPGAEWWQVAWPLDQLPLPKPQPWDPQGSRCSNRCFVTSSAASKALSRKHTLSIHTPEDLLRNCNWATLSHSTSACSTWIFYLGSFQVVHWTNCRLVRGSSPMWTRAYESAWLIALLQ